MEAQQVQGEYACLWKGPIDLNKKFHQVENFEN